MILDKVKETWAEREADFKPIHFYNHESCESFQIVSRKGLIAWINDHDLFHNAFDTFQELKEDCLTEEMKGENDER